LKVNLIFEFNGNMDHYDVDNVNNVIDTIFKTYNGKTFNTTNDGMISRKVGPILFEAAATKAREFQDLMDIETKSNTNGFSVNVLIKTVKENHHGAD